MALDYSEPTQNLRAGDWYIQDRLPTQSGLGYDNWSNFFTGSSMPYMKVPTVTEGFNSTFSSGPTIDYASQFVHPYQVQNALNYKYDPQKYAYAGPSAFDLWHAGVTNGGQLDRDPVEWAIEAQKNGRGWEDAIGEMLIPAMFGIAACGLGGLGGSGAGAGASAGDLIAGALADGGGASWMSGYGGLLGEGAATAGGGGSMFGDLGNLFGSSDWTPFDWSSITSEGIGNGVNLTGGPLDWTSLVEADPAKWGVDLSGFTGSIPSGSGSFIDQLINSVGGSPSSASNILKTVLGAGGGLGATALGGLLGSLNGSRQTGTSVVESAPWVGQQPYLLDLFSKAQGALGSIPQGPTADQTLATNQIRTASTGPMTNPYLGTDNPFLQKAIDKASGDVSTRINSQFGGTDYGTTAHQETLARGLGDVQNQMRMDDYSKQMGLAENDINRRVGATQNLYNIGEKQKYAPFDALGRYGDLIRGSYGSQQSSPIYSNPLSGMLGGAMMGGQLYGLLK